MRSKGDEMENRGSNVKTLRKMRKSLDVCEMRIKFH